MIPWTGLGLYGGYRGDCWMKNRIKIFEQFVIPSLIAQTNKNFVIWCAWRYQERSNKIVQDFAEKLSKIEELKFIHTWAGIPFYDDKYEDEIARKRLLEALHGSMGELINSMGECDEVYMTIQPSDDLYYSGMVEETHQYFEKHPEMNVFGYKKGYVMDYVNQRLCDWNPKTTPPFYTIKFSRGTFIEPLKHIEFTGPYKSHEYVKDFLKAEYIDKKGFLVGTHGVNISTVFDHPYTGHEYLGSNIQDILKDFGLKDVKKLKLPFSMGSVIFKRMPYGAKRKLRYWSGEKKWILRPLFALIYNILRA